MEDVYKRQPQSVEEIKAGLETTEKGGVRQSIRNCLTVFQRDPLLSGAIAYNILTDRKDIIKPIGFHRESTALNDTDMKYLLLYLEETYGLTNEKKIDNAIGIVANENKYHPIRDYLNTLVWDGTERIRFCLRHFLGADADDYTYEALKLFLLGAISRAFQPGCKFEIMLCLVGGQGAGKSTFFRLLAVRDEWFSDDLRKLDDDNAVSYTHLDVYKRQIYDSFILREIAEQPEQFKMAIVIGNVLGKYQLGISDVWTVSYTHLEKLAKKYGVDFAVRKDKSVDPPRFLVFVRSKDADALDAICKEHQARALTKNEKPSVLAQLKKFKEIVAAIPKKVREKKQERDL